MAQPEFGPNDIVIHLVNPYKCGDCGSEFCLRSLFLDHLSEHIEKLKAESPCSQIICATSLVEQQPNGITVTRDILQINEHQVFELQDPSLDYTQLTPLKTLEQAGILNLPPPRAVARPVYSKLMPKENPLILTIGEEPVRPEGKQISLLRNRSILPPKLEAETTSYVQVVSAPLEENKYEECLQQVITTDNIADLDSVVQQALFADGKIKEEYNITIEAPADFSSIFSNRVPDEDGKKTVSQSDKKSVSCPICLNVFASASVLERHQVVHTGAKPYPCLKCFKQFNDVSSMRKHMLIHKRQHRCPICHRMYLQRSQLSLHMKHHNKKRFIQFGNNFHEVRVEVSRNDEGQQVQEYSLLILLSEEELKNMSEKQNDVLTEEGKKETEILIVEAGEATGVEGETGVKSNLDTDLQEVAEHRKKIIYKCGHCKKLIFTRPTLSRHLIKHTNTRPFQCEKCLKTFRDKADLFHHHKTHTKPIQCSMCSSSFSKLLYLQNHLLKGCPMSINDGRFTVLDALKCQCNICNKILKNKANVLRHLRVHAFQDKQKQSLSGGDITQSTEGQDKIIADSLSQNIEEHYKGLENSVGYECLICGQEFRFKSFMITHVRMHLDQRPFKCEHCSKTFYAQHMLKKHVQNHTRPYKCPVCEKGFIRRYLMKHHFKKRHELEDGEDQMKDITELPNQKIIQCDICGKTMKSFQKSLMQFHIRQHKDVRPFPCRVCHKSFTNEHALKKHSMNHTKPYVCQVCHKGFSRRYLLTDHFNKKCSRKKSKNSSILKVVEPVNNELVNDGQEKGDSAVETKESDGHYDPPILTEYNEATGATTYTCEPCDKKFTVYDVLLRHVNTFARSTPCKYCNVVFEDKHLTIKHQRSCLGIPIDSSQKLAATLKNSQAVGEQQEKVKKIMKEISDKIELLSSQPGDVSEDKSELPSVDLDASVLGDSEKTSSSNPSLTRTLLVLKEDKGKYQCPECERTFSTLRGMKIHASSHVRLYKCEVCNKDFTHISSLRAHTPSHKTKCENPSESSQCSTELDKTSEEFLEEEAEASEENKTPVRKRRKTEADSEDETKMSIKDLEDVSQRLMLTGTRGRPYSCKMCRRRFTEQKGLEGHMVQIHGVKP
ncbi:zinc finger protein 26-like [Physella acuta]|uniref:zinc finger protein 26-like n=1 Tax=Physella acuta TaxID=109671 RepID=UPI0027DE7612|nr:zinc finger protein 26-like [Physella acuta]XP_059168629.1 zinc finger protein 26-like [Physella acuta]